MKAKKRMPIIKVAAIIMSILLVIGIMPNEIEADDPKYEGEIIGFIELDNDVAKQSVALGTDENELNLPGILTAIVEIELTEQGEEKTNGEALPGYKQVETEVGVTWQSVYNGQLASSYVFTALVADEGYALSEGLAMPAITVTVETEVEEEGVAESTDDLDQSGNYWACGQWIFKHGFVSVNAEFSDDGKTAGNYVYKSSVRTSLGDDYKEYASFCANYGSTSFGEEAHPYQATDLDPGKKANLLAAYNYIYDKYGSLDAWIDDLDEESRNGLGGEYDSSITVEESTKVLAQMVTWRLMDDNIVGLKAMYDSAGGLEQGRQYDAINEAVQDVLAHYQGHEGSGTVTDIVFLAGSNYPDDQGKVRPQIVPVFSDKAKAMDENGEQIVEEANEEAMKYAVSFIDEDGNMIGEAHMVTIGQH